MRAHTEKANKQRAPERGAVQKGGLHFKMVMLTEAEETKTCSQPKQEGIKVAECTLPTNQHLREFHRRDPAGKRDRVQMEI